MPELSNMNATEVYISENERVLRLERILSSAAKFPEFYPYSVGRLLGKRARALLGAWSYLHEICHGYRYLRPIIKLRGTGTDRRAIVIGNGPSQGYLRSEDLIEFQNRGGAIYVLNFWNKNKSLANVIPNYLMISDPDTLNANASADLRESNQELSHYLNQNSTIKIICPLLRCRELASKFGADRVVGVVDSEMRGWHAGTSPLFPRAYLSMTLYKVLAVAVWAGYSDIFVIGMDNTYPRNLYSDMHNRLLRLETHAGIDDFLIDLTEACGSVANIIFGIGEIFYDLRVFSRSKNIINLDPYSLTDAFPKVADRDSAKYIL